MGPQLRLWRESHLWGEMGVCAGGKGSLPRPPMPGQEQGEVEAALFLRCRLPLSAFTLREISHQAW